MTERHTIHTTAYAILRATKRRFLLAHLNGQRHPVSLSTLADAYVEWEGATDETSLDERRQRAEVAFHHVHLPMLQQAGVVDYDVEKLSVTAWRHDPLHGQWVDDPPVDRLARTVETNRARRPNPAATRPLEDAS
jgi:hypothetical protein